jgi:hypothetical protein
VGLAGAEIASLWDVATLLPALADVVDPTAPNSNRAVDLNSLGQMVGIGNRQAFVVTPK